MKKVIKALEELDPEDIPMLRKTLSGLHGDIIYFNRTGNFREIMGLRDIIQNFASINSTGSYHNTSHQRLIRELRQLVTLCNKLLGC